MPGPNSAPNGDTRIAIGHINAEYACEKHAQNELDRCLDRQGCRVVPLRHYLAERGKLRTGKTQKK